MISRLALTRILGHHQMATRHQKENSDKGMLRNAPRGLWEVVVYPGGGDAAPPFANTMLASWALKQSSYAFANTMLA